MVPPTFAALLAAPVTVAEPDVVGPLAVVPLIAASEPSFEYLYGAPSRTGTSGAAGARRGEGACTTRSSSSSVGSRRTPSGGCGEEGWELMEARTGTRGRDPRPPLGVGDTGFGFSLPAQVAARFLELAKQPTEGLARVGVDHAGPVDDQRRSRLESLELRAALDLVELLALTA
jgi:hypothetical protein